MLGKEIENSCLALTDKLKLRGDNSDPIEIRPELNCDSLPPLYVHLLAIQMFERFWALECASNPMSVLNISILLYTCGSWSELAECHNSSE